MTRFINYYLLISIVFATLFLSVACQQEDEEEPKPQACMSFNEYWFLGNSVDVQFGNCSSNATRYEWSFSNNQFSTAPEPLVTFAGRGRYQVVLDAFNAEGEVSQEVGFVNLGDLYTLDKININDPSNFYTQLNSEEFLLELFSYQVTYDSLDFRFIASTDDPYNFPYYVTLAVILLDESGNQIDVGSTYLLPKQANSLDLTTNLLVDNVTLESDSDRHSKITIQGDVKFKLITQ